MNDDAQLMALTADRFAPPFDPTALPRVLSRTRALQLGFSRHAVARRIASERWRRVLPHTYLTVDTLTWSDRLVAALAFAGQDALLSGAAALEFSGLRGVARPSVLLVLVPPRNRARSTGWVQICRTDRLPDPEPWYGRAECPSHAQSLITRCSCDASTTSAPW